MALLWLTNGLLLLYSNPMGDTNRDFHAALDIAEGLNFPVAGPAIAHAFHYSALWFYVLAGFFWLTASWAITSFLVGMLAGSVFPLLYLLGRSLAGRFAGLFAAALMAIPSWASVYYLVYSHPALIPAGAALCGLAMQRWWIVPTVKRGGVVGIALSVAAHAHIVNLGLVPVAVLIFFLKNGFSGRAVMVTLICGVGALSIFLPYLLSEALTGFSEIKAGAQYASDTDLVANVAALPIVYFNGIYGGLAFALTNIAQLQPFASTLFQIAIGALVLGAVLGILKPATAWPAWVGVAAIALLSQSLFGVVLRNFTPFYQILGVLPPLALILAWGASRTRSVTLLLVSMAMAGSLMVMQLSGLRKIGIAGAFRLDTNYLADLRARKGASWVQRWSLPAVDRDEVGAYLCNRQPAILRGHLAALVELSNALEVRLKCPHQRPDIWLWSDQPFLKVGAVNQAMANAIGLKGELIGNLMRVEILNDYSVGGPLQVSDASVYPPREVMAGAKSTRTFPVALSRDSFLVVVNAMNVWNPGATWVVSCDGRVLNSSYSDSESAAFVGADCKHAEIVVNAIRPDWVQIFEVSAYAEAPWKSR